MQKTLRKLSIPRWIVQDNPAKIYHIERALLSSGHFISWLARPDSLRIACNSCCQIPVAFADQSDEIQYEKSVTFRAEKLQRKGARRKDQ